MRSISRPVCVAGPVFLDVVMSGLSHAPRPGEEQWVPGCAVAPGGSANQAVALARLGLPVTLCCNLGEDRAGDLVRGALAEEGVDLRHARRTERQPVTVSLSLDGDRAMTSCGSDATPPLTGVPAPCALLTDLRVLAANRQSVGPWRAGREPAVVVGDVGWDATGRWDPADLAALDVADVVTPNDAEAMRYTRTGSARRAARALADRVALAVVTCGGRGVVACDGAQEIVLPAAPAQAVDVTGAGDSFAAALTWALVHSLPLRAALSLASIAASLTVEHPGGSTGAPTPARLAARARRTEPGPGYDLSFLDLLDDGEIASTTAPPPHEGTPR